MEDLKGKFIIAYRCRYFKEFKEHYNSATDRVRMFIVLNDYKDKLLVTCVRTPNYASTEYTKLVPEDYKCLKYVSSSNGEFYLINKSDVVCVLDDLLYKDYEKIFYYVKFFDIFQYDKMLRMLLLDSVSQYYNSKIVVGSIVTVQKAMDNYCVYYVTDKYENYFEGIPLSYDPVNGLSVKSTEKVYVNLASVYDSVFYLEEVEDRINEEIKKAKLIL